MYFYCQVMQASSGLELMISPSTLKEGGGAFWAGITKIRKLSMLIILEVKDDNQTWEIINIKRSLPDDTGLSLFEGGRFPC